MRAKCARLYRVPEGDSLHRLAAQLGPLLIGKAPHAFELVQKSGDTSALIGQTVTGVEARGKNLLVHFERGVSLHVHLKMWGRVFIWPLDQAKRSAGPNTVLVLDTDTHRIVVSEAPVARLIRTADLVRDLHFRHLGPDLLGGSFDQEEALRRLLLRKTLPLGEAVMDQSAVAGIGNLWKSELCFNLKLDPFAPLAACNEDELRALLALARAQLQQSVAHKPRRLPDPFTPRSSRVTRLDHRLGQKPLSVYERAGERCYDCGATIEMKRQGSTQRSTYYCPQCQPTRSQP
jgi:endonuclease-8